MQISPETIGVSDWIADSSLTEASRINRRQVVRLFERANGASMNQILSDIKNDKLTVYSACKRFVDHIRKDRAPQTVYVYRSQLVGLFQSVLGEDNFRRTVFDRLVPNGSVYVSHVKLVPTLQQVKQLLQIANPKYRAIIGMLSVTGMRIGELLSRQMSDFEVRPEGYARVKLQASETKARYRRYSFVTKECLDWLAAYRIDSQSEYAFGKTRDLHLEYTAVHQHVKRLFQRIGLNDASDKSEIYTIHSFRTFADSQMRNAGLDSKYASAILGHRNRLQSESNYLDWESIERAWAEKCSDRMTWLTPNTPVVEKLQKKNSLLESLLDLSDAQREKLFELLKQL
ncbi:MAG: hypothetical protein AUJ07_06460 [Crenarchaeota archaeon 13_1_40CM_3_53_5]|nr:MAG: hypothetical protein AUJ07_06460 [Crenarchaeota archaeon 13_1_40CM_3_53_5]